MTQLLILGVITGLLAACAAPKPPAKNIAANPLEPEKAPQKPVFLHLLAPSHPGEPAHRIASARVYLALDFSVSIGNADNPFTNKWDGAWTNAQIDTNGVAQPRPLESLWNEGDAVLAGRIDFREGKLFAHLQGRNGTTLNYFHGDIELEKPVQEHGGWHRGGTIWQVWFALSENPSPDPFLRQLQDGTLRSPALIERDSPDAKRWLELNSKSSGPANPDPN